MKFTSTCCCLFPLLSSVGCSCSLHRSGNYHVRDLQNRLGCAGGELSWRGYLMSRGKPFIYFVAAALCVSHAIAKDISFTEVRIPTRQSQVRLDVYQPNDQQPHPTI